MKEKMNEIKMKNQSKEQKKVFPISLVADAVVVASPPKPKPTIQKPEEEQQPIKMTR